MTTRRLFILTGASRGLGAAIARHLLAADTHLLTLSRHPDPALSDSARAARRRARTVGARPQPRHRLGRAPGDLAAPARRRAVHVGDADQQRRARRPGRTDRRERRGHARRRAARRTRGADAADERVPARHAHVGDRQARAEHLLGRRTARRRRLVGLLCGEGGAGSLHAASPRSTSRIAPTRPASCRSRPASSTPTCRASCATADPAGFPEQSNFVNMKASGQLPTPEAAAARVLAYLARADFGAQPVADVRDA